jgi:hypothetical protein
MYRVEDSLVLASDIWFVISAIGSLFVIICYFKFQDLQTFPYRLVLYLAIGSIIGAVGYLFLTPDYAWVAQAYVTNVSILSTWIWSTLIAFTIY